MKGVLKRNNAGWFVWYQVMVDEITSGYQSLPLHPDDVEQINMDAQVFDNIEARIAAYPNVEFDIVENKKMSGMVTYAKLVKSPSTDSQIEISDEEIEKGAREWYAKEGTYKPSAIALKTWGYAIKWYREQLKK